MIIKENIAFFMKTSFLSNAFMHPRLKFYVFYFFIYLDFSFYGLKKKNSPQYTRRVLLHCWQHGFTRGNYLLSVSGALCMIADKFHQPG
jgi:hypothetical protein